MSSNDKIHLEFPGRILLVGFGSIGQGVLPLILRHIGIAPERLTIVTAEDKGNEEAAKYGIKFVKERLDRKSTRLNSSHLVISYAVFCLKKKKKKKLYITSSSTSSLKIDITIPVLFYMNVES